MLRQKWAQIQETSREKIKNGAYQISLFFGEKAGYLKYY